jgi:hypothetical protein
MDARMLEVRYRNVWGLPISILWGNESNVSSFKQRPRHYEELTVRLQGVKHALNHTKNMNPSRCYSNPAIGDAPGYFGQLTALVPRLGLCRLTGVTLECQTPITPLRIPNFHSP